MCMCVYVCVFLSLSVGSDIVWDSGRVKKV